MKMENEVWDVKISPRSSCCEIHLPSSGEMRTRGFSGGLQQKTFDEDSKVFQCSVGFCVTYFF